jgi:toxin ParE1/3/4
MKLRWTPLAVGHLKSAREYLIQKNASAAANMIERILSGIESTRDRPQLGRKGRVSGTREFFITGTPFIVAYRLQDDRVEILAVLHGARRWPERF